MSCGKAWPDHEAKSCPCRGCRRLPRTRVEDRAVFMDIPVESQNSSHDLNFIGRRRIDLLPEVLYILQVPFPIVDEGEGTFNLRGRDRDEGFLHLPLFTLRGYTSTFPSLGFGCRCGFFNWSLKRLFDLSLPFAWYLR